MSLCQWKIDDGCRWEQFERSPNLRSLTRFVGTADCCMVVSDVDVDGVTGVTLAGRAFEFFSFAAAGLGILVVYADAAVI